MPIKPLAEVRVEHPFYAAGVCVDARIVPDPATASRLRGLRLITRATPGGLTLFGQLADDGTALIAFPPVTLRFDLLRLAPEIEASTELTGIAPGTVFVEAGATKPMKPVVWEARASETVAKPEGSVTVVLAGRPLPGTVAAAFKVLSPATGITVTGYDQASRTVRLKGPAAPVELDYPVAPESAPGTLAGIEFALAPADVAKAAAGQPRRFTIALKPAAARWCYHLVTDLPDPLGDWRIAHPTADGPLARFGEAGKAEVAAPDAADPLGSDLLSRSAPLRILRFVSDAPVACSEIRARRVALFAGERQLFAALPNPSPAAVRQLAGEPVFSEVLRFVTT